MSRIKNKRILKRIIPEIQFVAYSIYELVNIVKDQFFSDINHKVSINFFYQRPLACIQHNDESASIKMHSILNHKETPKEVILFVIKHELLHLAIPPRVIKKRLVKHPPEFFEREKFISPEYELIWRWLDYNFFHCLKVCNRKEQVLVTSEWKEIMYEKRLSFKEVMDIISPKEASRALEMSFI